MPNKPIIDARGLSCPQPVLMTKQALASGGNAYQVLVDNATARENVTRFAQNAGYQVKVSQQGEDFCLDLKR